MNRPDLPIYELLQLASGSWSNLDDLVARMARQPEIWMRDALQAIELPTDVPPLDLDLRSLEAAQGRLRAADGRLDPELMVLANLLIVLLGAAHGRLLTSASVPEVEHAFAALAGVLPSDWDEAMDQALSSPLLDRPGDRPTDRAAG